MQRALPALPPGLRVKNFRNVDVSRRRAVFGTIRTGYAMNRKGVMVMSNEMMRRIKGACRKQGLGAPPPSRVHGDRRKADRDRRDNARRILARADREG